MQASQNPVYAFEDLPSDLPRPPMAAMRALLSVGKVLSPRGWAKLTLEARQGLAVAGASAQLDVRRIEELVREAGVGDLRLVPQLRESDALPPDLVAALAPVRRLNEEDWRELTALDRHVLRSLVLNTRLLLRAAQEILPEAVASSSDGWLATVAHCHLRARPEAIEVLRSATFLDGRAMVLARVAGVRAARRAAETFDLRSEVGTGTIELDWAPDGDVGVIRWQAHVSSWDGAFFPAASLAAAVTAATALCDMIRDVDPDAQVTGAKIVDEAWTVGTAAFQEHATAVYSAGARANVMNQIARGAPPIVQTLVAGSSPALPQGQAAAMPAPPHVFQHGMPQAMAPQQGLQHAMPYAMQPGMPPNARPAMPMHALPAGLQSAARGTPRAAAPANRSQQALIIVVLGLLVLLLLVAVAILVVVARS